MKKSKHLKPITFWLSKEDANDKLLMDNLRAICKSLHDDKAWFCGHWHTDKRIDRMHFLFNSFEDRDMI